MWSKIFPKKFRLAITGMEGVGKTVLFDSLTGKAFEPGYQKPRRSQSKEAGKVPSANSKILVSVVPGQVAHPRFLALDEIFLGKHPVNGMIHVVSSGFASIRSTDAVRVLVNDHSITTIHKFRQHQKKRELEDLQGTCRIIHNAHFKHRAPTWLVVAVDKIDLYHDELGDVERLYSPSARTDFVKELNTLVRRLGTDFFQWTALPVVGYIEDFEWNGQIQRTQLKEEDRRNYVKQFLTSTVREVSGQQAGGSARIPFRIA
jgi:GTPase SAR1 family protein